MAEQRATGEQEDSATLHIVSAHARLKELIDDGSIVAVETRRRGNKIRVKFIGYLNYTIDSDRLAS